MSICGKRVVGIPTILLYEAEGCTIMVQTRDGSIFKGKADDIEDTWNLNLTDVLMRTKGSKVDIPFPRVFLRGAEIEFIVLPEILKKSPLFERVIEFRNGNVIPGSTTESSNVLNRNHCRQSFCGHIP